ncbi:EF-hand domain-containing protein [Entamoeba marina]
MEGMLSSRLKINQNGLISMFDIIKEIEKEVSAKDVREMILNMLFIIDTDNDGFLTCGQFSKFEEQYTNVRLIQQNVAAQYKTVNVPFPENEKLRILFDCFETDQNSQISTEQILQWSRKINNPQKRVYIETSLHNLKTNKCSKEMFVEKFISPDGYIMEHCPKYIKAFEEIDLNGNGTIDLQEIMYHLSKIFVVPESMRAFVTTVLGLLDSDGDNELNLVEFVKYLLALNRLFDLAGGGEITKEVMMRVLYELVDVDGSGLIDAMEMEKYFEVLETPLESREFVRRVMKEYGGVIDFGVFSCLYS